MSRVGAVGLLTAVVLMPFALTLVAISGQRASATESTFGSPLLPRCAHGDPPVGVNRMSKRYVTLSQMRIKTTGMSDAQILTMMMKEHVKMMCQSKAKAMGATMMRPNGRP